MGQSTYPRTVGELSTRITGDAGTGRQTFSYDRLGRLIGSSGLASGSRSYAYDHDGNRTLKNEGGLTTTAAYDRTGALTTITRSDVGVPLAATVDAFGNLTSNPETGVAATTFGYDAADRLRAIDATGTADDATFTFDALGRHATRTIDGVTEAYEFAGTSETVTRIGTGSPIESLVDQSGARLATRQSASVAWLLPDPHGSVAGGATGTSLSAALRYDGYGQLIARHPTSLPDRAARFTYQGRLDIAPAGLGTPLLEMGARFYSPGLGSFSQADTVIGSALDPVSLNRYLYAHANPTSLIDPTGRTAQPACDTAKYDFCNRYSIPVGSQPNGNAKERYNPPPGGGSSAKVKPKTKAGGAKPPARIERPAAKEAGGPSASRNALEPPGSLLVPDGASTVCHPRNPYRDRFCDPASAMGQISADQVAAGIGVTVLVIGGVLVCIAACPAIAAGAGAAGAALAAGQGLVAAGTILCIRACTAIGSVATYGTDVACGCLTGGETGPRLPATSRNPYGPAAKPVRIEGPWPRSDIYRGLQGMPPRSLGSPDLHHADQMPGSPIHEVVPTLHRGNRSLHQNRWNQGVTDEMRKADKELHWWYRAQEMGAWDSFDPTVIYSNWPGRPDG